MVDFHGKHHVDHASKEKSGIFPRENRVEDLFSRDATFSKNFYLTAGSLPGSTNRIQKQTLTVMKEQINMLRFPQKVPYLLKGIKYKDRLVVEEKQLLAKELKEIDDWENTVLADHKSATVASVPQIQKQAAGHAAGKGSKK